MQPTLAAEELSRESWIRAAARALAAGGVDRVRVEPLARELGVTKGSFYWHFTHRRALLDAVIREWERVGTRAIIEEVRAHAEGPEDALERLWAVASGTGGLEVELALRELARHDGAAKEAVERVDRTRMRFLRRRFRALGHSPLDAEARSLTFYALLIGDHFIRPSHGRMSRKRVLETARALLTR